MNRRRIVLLCATLALAHMQTIMASETGRRAPNCVLTSVGDEHRFDIHQFQGKVLYVDFWASWCSPCAKSFPFLNDLDREFRDRGLQIIGVNLDEERSDAQNFLAKHPANFTVAIKSNKQCAKDFGVKAMPSSYLVDRNGVIRHVHLGFRAGEAKQLRALVEHLLAESPAGQ
jgi:Peroxiredoxin